MTNVPGYFDELFLQDARFGEPQWSGTDLIVPAYGIIALEAHPLAQGHRILVDGRLRFSGTVSSTRDVFEYLGDPRDGGFHDSYTVIDHPPESPPDGPTQILGFDGVLLRPLAFVDWEVRCAGFGLEVDEAEKGS